MKLASSPFASLGLALVLTATPLLAQLNDGKPDPDFAVPAALDLPYALAFALDNNFAIRQAKERIRQQEGVILEVRSAQLPNVAGTGGYQRNADEVSTNGRDQAWSVEVTAGRRTPVLLGVPPIPVRHAIRRTRSPYRRSNPASCSRRSVPDCANLTTEARRGPRIYRRRRSTSVRSG